MNIHLTKSQIGLDGVPAAETVLSHVDGQRGELIIAGEHVGTLASQSSFEGVTARLWNGASKTTLSEANVRRIASSGMLLNNFAPMTWAASPKRVGVVNGGKDQ